MNKGLWYFQSGIDNAVELSISPFNSFYACDFTFCNGDLIENFDLNLHWIASFLFAYFTFQTHAKHKKSISWFISQNFSQRFPVDCFNNSSLLLGFFLLREKNEWMHFPNNYTIFSTTHYYLTICLHLLFLYSCKTINFLFIVIWLMVNIVNGTQVWHV